MVQYLHNLFSRLEDLFYKYGVDVILEAHEHDYERLWPVYNEHVTAKSYVNPKAPVHLISGTVGCNEAMGECFNPTLGPRGKLPTHKHPLQTNIAHNFLFRSLVGVPLVVAQSPWIWKVEGCQHHPPAVGAGDR